MLLFEVNALLTVTVLLSTCAVCLGECPVNGDSSAVNLCCLFLVKALLTVIVKLSSCAVCLG